MTEAGFYCPAGDFYIDPWLGVDRAVITHAHGDHARAGSRRYLAANGNAALLPTRLGGDADIQTVDYAAPVTLGGVRVSLHPAGHILGSAQVRVEHRGEVWVVSGDYKTEPDPTCVPFEPVPCHTFVTESTFGLPIYRWPTQVEVWAQINAWWCANRDAGRASVIFAYALGKSQRLLACVDSSIGPIYTHGATERLTQDYRAGGVSLPQTTLATRAQRGAYGGSLILAPMLAIGTPWLRRFGDISTAGTSGWMRIRGARRRQSLDRGFVLSDHADWTSLLKVIAATGAQRVLVTHGYVSVLVRWLREHGFEAESVATRFEGERLENPGTEPVADASADVESEADTP